MKTAQSPTSNRMLFNVKVLLPVLQTFCRTQDFCSWHLYCQIFESLKCCWILADSPLFLKLDACLRSRPECQWQLSHKIHTSHYFILELEILCHIPHCLKSRYTFLIFSVWPIVGNVHSMGFASWCHGLIWISLEWKNRYTICQNVCHMFDKY